MSDMLADRRRYKAALETLRRIRGKSDDVRHGTQLPGVDEWRQDGVGGLLQRISKGEDTWLLAAS